MVDSVVISTEDFSALVHYATTGVLYEAVEGEPGAEEAAATLIRMRAKLEQVTERAK